MVNENQENVVDAEHALRHVIDIICKYVDQADLLSVSLVCRSWCYEAQRELRRRHVCIQRLCFTYRENGWIRNMARRIPSASLFVYETRLEQLYNLFTIRAEECNYDVLTNGFEEELLDYFKILRIRNKKIVLNVNKYLTTEDAEFQVDNEPRNLNPVPDNNILGLFFVNEGQRFNVRVTSIPMMHPFFYNTFRIWRHTLSERIAEYLGLDDTLERTQSKSIILIVGACESYQNRIICPFLREFFLRYRQNCREIKFASIFGVKLVMGEHNVIDPEADNSRSIILMRISGQTLATYSTYIYCRAGQVDIDTKLHQLRDQWQRESRVYNIGLVYSRNCTIPTCRHAHHPTSNSRGIMSSLRRFFPRIQFAGFFLDGNSENYFCPRSERQTYHLPQYIFDDGK